tara:strand:- start:94 stop:291 length:198 start_codon:yes stop_codon:yes gene_type:complete
MNDKTTELPMMPRPIMEQPKEVKSIKVSTPIGDIESDSGNHLVDIGTIIFIILIFFAMKRYFKTA